MIAFLTLLFCIGLSGNLWAIVCVLWTWFNGRLPARGVFRYMSVYIFLLSISDVFVLIMMALGTAYISHQSWSYSLTSCKIFWAADYVSKLMSNAILASISVERCLAVCKPVQVNGFRNQIIRVFIVVVIQLFFMAALCIPVVYYAEIVEMEVWPEHHDLNVEPEIVEMCRSDMPDDIFPYYVILLIIFGCLVPTMTTWCSYVFLVVRLGQKSGANVFVQAYRSRVAVFLFLAVTIHFICTAPMWYSMLAIVTPEWLWVPSPDLLQVFTLLPYVNCAVNWILHALMNRELRKASSSLLCTRISQGGSYAVMSLTPSPLQEINSPLRQSIKTSTHSLKSLLTGEKKKNIHLSTELSI